MGESALDGSTTTDELRSLVAAALASQRPVDRAYRELWKRIADAPQ